MALASVLPPGYRAFKAVQEQNQQADSGEILKAREAVGLMAALDKQKQDAALRQLLASTNGDVEQAAEMAIKSGNIGAAHQLAPLIKLQQEKRETAETQQGLAALLAPRPAPSVNPMVPGPGASVMAGGGDVVPTAAPAPDPVQARIKHLNDLSMLPKYAKNPIVMQRIQAEIDKLQATADKPPQKRERISGETLIQEEYRGGKWEEVGRGPRFAKQVAAPNQVGGVPGGVGSSMMQDPNTGQRYMVNTKEGKAWELDDEGLWKATNVNNLPKNLQKVGNIGAAGARESVFTQRMIQAGNQAAKDLDNVVKLPLTASRGPFGAFGATTTPSFLDAGKVALGNVMTTQEQQTYNAMATGFQRTLAAIEAAGLMPSGSLTHQMDAVLYKPGDTQLTKLHKLAQTRQIVESGMEVILSNPRISDSEKEKVKEVIERVKKAVPFSHADLVTLAQKQSTDPNATLRGVLKKDESAPTGGAYSDPEKERRYQEYKKRQTGG